MKALKTKVILSGIVLVFAFIATIGTTFAWFTVSNTATVDTMTLNVTSADSLNILANDQSETYATNGGGVLDLTVASNYDTTIDVLELAAAGYDVENYLLQPVTAIDTDYSGFDASSLATIDLDTRNLTATTNSNDANGDYIQLQFWLFAQSENADEVIELNSLSISSVTGNTTAQSDVVNAIRFAIWAGETGAVSGPTTPTTAVVFGLDTDYGYTFAGTINEDALVGDTLQEIADLQSGSATLQADAAADVNTALTTDIFTITANVPTLVTVLIYLEGFDASTTNDISLADFDFTFGFKYGTAGDTN